MTEEY